MINSLYNIQEGKTQEKKLKLQTTPQLSVSCTLTEKLLPIIFQNNMTQLNI